MEPRCFAGVIGDGLPSIINLSQEHEILSENISQWETHCEQLHTRRIQDAQKWAQAEVLILQPHDEKKSFIKRPFSWERLRAGEEDHGG